MKSKKKAGQSIKQIRHLIHKGILINLCVIIGILLFLQPANPAAAKGAKNSYTITPKDVPHNKSYIKYSTYNEKTKGYYTLRSYLELLEEKGGGTLTLSKGTYIVTNTLYVPSNTTIVLKKGAVIKKGDDTGTAGLSSSKSLFQLIAPSKSSKANAVSKYNGEKNITFKGSGTIDLAYVKDAAGIITGHSSNITIDGITFKNTRNGNFIKAGAVKNLVIKNNTFKTHKDSDSNSREAIGIETPDNTTGSFNYSWSKADKTVCEDIIIENNIFTNLERAIGSTKYTEGKYHKNIQIKDNVITKTDSSAIRILNWDSPIITNNEFHNITNQEENLKVILISGVKNPLITDNLFTNSDRAIQIMPAKNNGNGSKYKTTYNTISDENKENMLKNTLQNMKEHYIRYNKTYNEFTLDTEKWDVVDTSEKDFIVTPKDTPYKNYFTNYSTYDKSTRQYYVLRSYLEHLERTGGGTLTLTKGIYEITNTLYVPSNVTIILEDGVVIRKVEGDEDSLLTSSKSIFQLAAPSKSKEAGYYKKYNGEHTIRFMGKGSAVIDLNYVEDAIGILMGHNTNITVTGITFTNMFSGHFLEIDAAKDVTVTKNQFLNSKSSKSGIKEGINLDTPDNVTKGFNVVWTSFDKTPNQNVLIEDNVFKNLERAIGTHKYSEGKYHEDIKIIKNTITETSSDAIRILNWKNPIIKENTIEQVKGENDRAILASGVINPVITKNIFQSMPRAIQIMPWKNNDSGSEYSITYNTLSDENIEAMRDNQLINVGETFIRINTVYNVFDKSTDKHYFK